MISNINKHYEEHETGTSDREDDERWSGKALSEEEISIL